MPPLDQLVAATTLTGAEESSSLERLEALGDAVLRFIATLAVFLNRFLAFLLIFSDACL